MTRLPERTWQTFFCIAALAWFVATPTTLTAQPSSISSQKIWPATTFSGTVFSGNGKSPLAKAAKPMKAYLHGVRVADTDHDALPLGNPFGIEILGDDVWITTVDDQCIWKTSLLTKDITRVAGNGTKGYSGDGGPALKATFNWPHEVRVDSDGNLYIADTRNHVIRFIDARTQTVTTLAGDGSEGFRGEGKAGDSVQFSQPHSVVLDQAGGLLVADTKNHRVRRIDLATGIVTTIAGTGQPKLPSDGEVAKTAPLFGPRSLAVDKAFIWIALREGNSIWRIDRSAGTLHRVAGTGKKGYSGDGGDPKLATFRGPKGIAIDAAGNLLIVDTENHAVRKLDFQSNTVSTVLGGKMAKKTRTLKRPHGISAVLHPESPKFIVGDSENHVVIIK